MLAVAGPTPVTAAGAVGRPRLVASDLDGTLLGDDGLISARTARALTRVQEAGIEVVFVTARPPRWLDGLADVVGSHGVVLCLNGAAVYDAARREVLSETPLADELVTALLADLRRALPGISFAAERATGMVAEHGFPHGHRVPPGTPHAATLEELLDGRTGKLLARCPDVPAADLVARVHEALDGRALVADSGAAGLAEITGPGVTKAVALAAWAAERGILAEEVWAFGDMPNDLPMLGWAGRSFGVANAHPDVLAAVDVVCGSNADDGVAVELETLLT